MNKIINLVLESCKTCPYMEYINSCLYYCKYEQAKKLLGIDYRERVFDFKIPEWCKLPDSDRSSY